MATPEWAENVSWPCSGCGRSWPSLWARDLCLQDHDDEDRAARRRRE